jgi:acetylornithine deacetylase/succinyl-diaminopimelate desuccinylase-like protein
MTPDKNALQEELEAEAIRICQELIRIPSVNYGEGRGDEKAVAEYVVAQLAEVGIASKVYESAPNRCNVIAYLESSHPERPGLVVHGHLDVVPAMAEDWSVDPFGGILKDGFIWGRGAVDMKNMDAMIEAFLVRTKAVRPNINPKFDPNKYDATQEGVGKMRQKKSSAKPIKPKPTGR